MKHALVIGLVLLFPLGVAAQTGGQESRPPPMSDTDAEARALFEAAEIAYANGRFADALGSLERAYALSGRPELLFNLGSCLDRLGRRAEALDSFRRYLEARPDAVNRNFVRGRMAILESELREAAVTSGAGTEPATTEPATSEPATSGPTNEAPVPEGSTEDPARGSDDSLLVASLVSLGVAGAAAVTMTITGALSLDAHGALSSRCPGGACSQAEQSAIDELRTLTTTTDVALVVTAVAATVGVTLLVLHLTSGPTADATVACGPLGCQLRATF